MLSKLVANTSATAQAQLNQVRSNQQGFSQVISNQGRVNQVRANQQGVHQQKLGRKPQDVFCKSCHQTVSTTLIYLIPRPENYAVSASTRPFNIFMHNCMDTISLTEFFRTNFRPASVFSVISKYILLFQVV